MNKRQQTAKRWAQVLDEIAGGKSRGGNHYRKRIREIDKHRARGHAAYRRARV